MSYVTPGLILVILIISISKKVPVYDSMRDGITDGMGVIMKILPSMMCVMAAGGMLRASGLMELLVRLLSPVTDVLRIPGGAVPMMLMRPVSGSGALGLLAENINVYGADSPEGLISSIIMGSTETTFYTLSVYFGSVGTKSTGKTALCALIGDIAGAAAAVIAVDFIIF